MGDAAPKNHCDLQLKVSHAQCADLVLGSVLHELPVPACIPLNSQAGLGSLLLLLMVRRAYPVDLLGSCSTVSHVRQHLQEQAF